MVMLSHHSHLAGHWNLSNVPVGRNHGKYSPFIASILINKCRDSLDQQSLCARAHMGPEGCTFHPHGRVISAPSEQGASLSASRDH